MGLGLHAANAAFVLNFTDENGIVHSVTDNLPGDRNPNVGVIQYSYKVPGAFQIDAIVGSSNAPTGPTAAGNPATLQQVNLIFAGKADLGFKTFSVELSDDTFNFPGAAGATYTLTSRLTGSVTSGVGSTAVFFSTAAPDLATTPSLSFVSTTPVDDAFSLQNSVDYVRTSTPYTLSNKLTFTINTTASALFTGVTTVVPESNSLFLVGLAGLATIRRRRA
jgi:hypothetical protein